MDKKEFNKGFKLFKRFLKENGMYQPIFKFLFKNGRQPIHLFYEFNSKRFLDVDDWGQVLFNTNLMVGKGEGTYDKGDFFSRLNIDEYTELVSKTHIAYKWRDYYREYKKKKKKK
jgi:hypothetical protein